MALKLVIETSIETCTRTGVNEEVTCLEDGRQEDKRHQCLDRPDPTQLTMDRQHTPHTACNALIKHVIDSKKMHLELLSVQFNVYSYSGFITFCELDIDIITYFHIREILIVTNTTLPLTLTTRTVLIWLCCYPYNFQITWCCYLDNRNCVELIMLVSVTVSFPNVVLWILFPSWNQHQPVIRPEETLALWKSMPDDRLHLPLEWILDAIRLNGGNWYEYCILKGYIKRATLAAFFGSIDGENRVNVRLFYLLAKWKQ